MPEEKELGSRPIPEFFTPPDRGPQPEQQEATIEEQKEVQYLGHAEFDEVENTEQQDPAAQAFEVPTAEQARQEIPPEVADSKVKEIQETLLSFLNGDSAKDLHDMQELGLDASQIPDNSS